MVPTTVERWILPVRLVDDPEANREGLTLPSDFNSRLSVVEVTGAKRERNTRVTTYPKKPRWLAGKWIL